MLQRLGADADDFQIGFAEGDTVDGVTTTIVIENSGYKFEKKFNLTVLKK